MGIARGSWGSVVVVIEEGWIRWRDGETERQREREREAERPTERDREKDRERGMKIE